MCVCVFVCVVSYCNKPWDKIKQQRRQGVCTVKTFIFNRMVWDRLIIKLTPEQRAEGGKTMRPSHVHKDPRQREQ